MKIEAPQWFRRTVADGLKVLVALSLANEPALDLMPATKQLWIHLLWRHGAWVEADAERILEGFTRLATRIDRWPAPRQLLDTLPRRPQAKALEAQPASREEALAHLAEMRNILRGVKE